MRPMNVGGGKGQREGSGWECNGWGVGGGGRRKKREMSRLGEIKPIVP